LAIASRYPYQKTLFVYLEILLAFRKACRFGTKIGSFKYPLVRDQSMSNPFRTSGYHPLRKLKVILAGLHVAVVTDFSVAYKVVLSVPVLGAAFVLRKWIDGELVLLAVGLVLIAELFNSAIEVLCDFVEPSYSDRIRVVKDIAAAAAGLSIFVWAAILLIEGIQLWQLWWR
jgi:diacylglycerol kinase